MLKILVLDDEELICWSISKELSKFGYIVDSALSGRDAISMMKYNNYDLIIADIRLPDISGFEVVETLKKFIPPVKIIMMSSYELDDEKINYLKKSTFGFLAKPVNPLVLNSLIDMMIINDSAQYKTGMGIKFYSFKSEIHDILHPDLPKVNDPNSLAFAEKRKSERYAVDFDVFYTFDKHLIHAKVSDISKEGAFVATGLSLEVGSPIDMDLYTINREKSLSAFGKVVRSASK